MVGFPNNEDGHPLLGLLGLLHEVAWNEHKQNFNLLLLVAAEENNVFHYTAIISSCGESFKWECALNFLKEMADSQARWIKSHIPNISQQKIVGEFQGATNMQ